MRPAHATFAAALAALTCSPLLAAAPRNTVWLEDLHIEDANAVETSLIYEYQTTDFKAFEAGTDVLTLRLHAGLSERLELAPVVRVRQRSVDPLQLHELGAEARVRAIGEPDLPNLLVYGAYYNDTSLERDHRMLAGGAGRLYFGRLFVSADLRPSLGLGGDRDDAFELWMGAGAGFMFLPDRELTAGIETFAIVPITGERLSDPTYGAAATSATCYYGPSLSFRRGPFWTAASAVSGYFLLDGASDLLVRWMVGVGQ
ncbi:MAG TPA: hypothetical protein VI072_34800 [Polyangiaceae bacterium]